VATFACLCVLLSWGVTDIDRSRFIEWSASCGAAIVSAPPFTTVTALVLDHLTARWWRGDGDDDADDADNNNNDNNYYYYYDCYDC
jgi:hypothetical protein